jgi:hypothetical protein
LITTLKEKEIRNLKQAAKKRQERGLRERRILDKGNLEMLRASKKQRREERKIKIVQEREEKACEGAIGACCPKLSPSLRLLLPAYLHFLMVSPATDTAFFASDCADLANWVVTDNSERSFQSSPIGEWVARNSTYSNKTIG